MELSPGDVVRMKKKHPCGSDEWAVLRAGADVKLKCAGCGRVVMLDRAAFDKRMKEILRRAGEDLKA